MRRSIFVGIGFAILAALLGGCGGGSNGGNEGVLSFTSSGYTVNEDGTLGTAITIHREGGGAAISVTVVFADGTATSPADYDSTPQVVLWAAGDLADKTIVVPIVDDNNDEPDEFLTMTLTNATGGAVTGTPDSATLTILDDPNDVAGTVQFSAPDYSYAEDGTPIGMAVTVTRVGGIDGDVSVLVTSADGTANSDPNSVVEPVDYSPVNAVAFFADQDATPVVISLSIVQDLLPELNETFTVSLSNPTNGATLGAPSSAVVTIFDDDPLLQLDNPLGTLNGFFGSSLAKAGQRLAIGATGQDPSTGADGLVYLFNFNSMSFLALGGGPFTQGFGSSLSASGDALAVGGIGHAYFFDGTSSPTAFLPERFRVTSSDAGFGQSILLNGGSVFVGAPLAQIAGSLSPSGRVYPYDALTGAPRPVLDGAADDQFGAALAPYGPDLLIGAPGNTGSVLRYGGSPLALTLPIPNPFPEAPSPSFGAAVANLNGMIIVGSPDADTFAPNDGRVYRLAGGLPQALLAPGPIVPGGRFGAQILTTSTGLTYVQQPGGAGGIGRVFVFDIDGNLLQTIDDPVPAPNANFGASMCEFDGAVAIGAPSNPFLLQSGSVFIFRQP